MARIRIQFAVVISIWAVAVAGWALEAPNDPDFVDYARGVIAIELTSPLPDGQMRVAPSGYATVGIASLDAIAAKYAVSSIQPMFPGAEPRTYEGQTVDLSRYCVVRFDSTISLDSILNDYRQDPNVVGADPNAIYRPDAVPNDPHYTDQWHLNQFSDHDLDAPEAWGLQTGNPVIVVAVIDEGVHHYHKDLGGANASYLTPAASRGNMWINNAELNGLPGVDDDHNGFTDDWIGWDFWDNDNDPAPPDGATHGTLGAGLITAMTNDGYGTAGVAGGWGNGTLSVVGNGVRVMAIRAGNHNGIGSFESASGFYYAARNGARIANLSRRVPASVTHLQNAMLYFAAGGGLIFKAAGNANETANDWADQRTDMMSVAATDAFDQKASFSNYGYSIDISAPGEGVWSTSSSGPAGDTWGAASGTSFSSPIAAGVAALIWSQHPDWTAAQVRERLRSSADNINLFLQPQYIGKMGAGRVNAYRGVSGQVDIRVPADAPTIQAGIDIAPTNARVLVSPGTYSGSGNVDIRFNGKPVEVVSTYGADATIIDCQGAARGFIFDGAETPSSVLSGFTIINGNAGIQAGGGIFIAMDEGEGDGDMIPLLPCSPTIRNCVIRDCRAGMGGGIYVSSLSRAIIENCTIVNDSAGQGAGIMYERATTDALFNRSIVAFNKGEGIRGAYFGSRSLTWACNVYWGNSGGDVVALSTGGVDNRQADPMFCDRSAGDYHTWIYSPCDIHNSPCGLPIGALGRCQTPFAGRGDVNRNGTPFEAADLALFRQWFDAGDAVFTVDLDAQRRATDVNCDGFVLSSEDYEQLSGIVYSGAPSACPGSPPITRPTDTLRVIDTSYAKGAVRKGIDLYLAFRGSGIDGLLTGLNARITYNPRVLTPHWDPAFGDGRHVEFERLGPLAGYRGDIVVRSLRPGELLISIIYAPAGVPMFPIFAASSRILMIFFDVNNLQVMPSSSPLTLANAGYFDNHNNRFARAIIPTLVNGTLTIPPPPSCPMLFAHDGAAFVPENPLLTACEASGYRAVVTDYYHIKKTVPSPDGVVSLQLRELEDEISTIEELELLTVDHSSEFQVAVASDGRIATYRDVRAPLSAVDQDGNDRLAEVRDNDGVLFSAQGPGHLILTFPTEDRSSTGYTLCASAKPQCPVPVDSLPKTGPEPSVRTTSDPVVVEALGTAGTWVPLGSLSPRQHGVDEAVMADAAAVDPSGVTTIRVSWSDRYTTDAIRQFIKSEEEPQIARWAIAASDLTRANDGAEARVGFESGSPLVLRKGDVLQFRFATGPLPTSATRDFVLRARGRYEPNPAIYGSSVPADFQVFANYPNPFNAGTTIEFALARPGHVAVRIYNILGQPVRTLVDRELPAGNHRAVWDAADESGNPVASGTYLYRVTSGQHVVTRTMVLVK